MGKFQKSQDEALNQWRQYGFTDLYDQVNFYKFFKDLYSEQTIIPEIDSYLKEKARSLQQESVYKGTSRALNGIITMPTTQKHLKAQKKESCSRGRFTKQIFQISHW